MSQPTGDRVESGDEFEGQLRLDASVFESLSRPTDEDSEPRIVRWLDAWSG